MSSGKKITELGLQSSLDVADLFAVVDVSASQTNRFTYANLISGLTSDLPFIQASDSPNITGTFDFTGGGALASDPTASSEVANKSYVDAVLTNTAWKEPIESFFDPSGGLPGSPTIGDRHVALATANGWTVDRIYEYNGSTWDDTIPTEGFTLYDKDSDANYNYNGSAWIQIGSGGGGNVSNSGTPLVNQLAFWLDATTIQASSDFTVSGSAIIIGGNLSLQNQTVSTTSGNDNLILDAAGTGVLVSQQDFNMSSNDITNVGTINGVSLTTGGSATNFLNEQGNYVSAGGGGNVSNTGTPLNDQLAVWTSATVIEGQANLGWNGSALTVGDGAAGANIILDSAGTASVNTGKSDSQIAVSGGNGVSDGLNLFLYGSTHASQANELEIRTSATTRALMDANGDWDFQANDLANIGDTDTDSLTISGIAAGSGNTNLLTIDDTGSVGSITSAALLSKVIDIGDWNMDSSLSVNVAHGVTRANIRSVDVIIRNDADTTSYSLLGNGTATGGSPNGVKNGHIGNIDGTNIVLARTESGFFDDTDFDSTSYNRGWVTVWYTA